MNTEKSRRIEAALSGRTQGITRRNFLKMSGAGLAGVALLGGVTSCNGDGAEGQEFPSDTIEIIIPYAPGGSTDVSVRQMAAAAEETCGTSIIASNQEGSAGAVGFTATANAEPNGYTVGATANELAYLYQLGIVEVSPDDVMGVMRYALNPHVFFVPDGSPYQTMEELISAAEDGETFNVATSGTGSVYHLAFAGMALEAGVPNQFRNLPFDGGAAAVQAVLGGDADMTVTVFQEAASQVEAGEFRALAVAAEDRLEDPLPDVPTLPEIGIDWTSASHLGLAVPNGTPKDRLETLSECLYEAIETDEFRQAMEEQNLTIDYLPPREFDEYLQQLSDQYGTVVEELNLKDPEE